MRAAALRRQLPFLALGATLVVGLFLPLALKLSAPGFWFEVLLGGLMAGVLYSLVALGFVLIFKASGVFNFAQGAMVLFAALAVARLAEKMPLWVAILIAVAIMVALAFVIERLVLRPLVNQDGVVLLMATLGVTYFLDGFGQTVWGSDIYEINLGIRREPVMILDHVFQGGILINRDDVAAAIVAVVLVCALALFFQKTKTGRALRAVADDHQAALAVGIPLEQIWVVVWSASGFVALVAGILWGCRTGVQFSLTFTALKALPVLILGGFTSIPGAIVGGLLVGASEKLAEVYLGPHIGSGLENWFPYALATLFLLVRPEGLFGEKRIERV
jgi:branched-chain amino acid transport system permease protein